VTVTSQPHFIYARYGQDLVYTQNITLAEALTGRKFKVPLLDGRVLPMSLTEIASPGYKICVSGEGIPIWDEVHNEVTGHGNLYVAFSVEWPVNRSDAVWEQLVAGFQALAE
jgi:DnaJ-class molecular chaperone